MKYVELMDKIDLTPEMRERVLENVQRKMSEKPERKNVVLRRVLPLAACLALVITAALVFSPPASPGVDIVPGIEEVEDLEALSEAVGFEVQEPVGLPFEIGAVEYTNYGGMAQIALYGEEESAVYRKAAGTEPVSGDYTDYSSVTELTVRGAEVTLKGAEDGRYTLAEWSDGAYSYSLSLTISMDESGWAELIANNSE